MIDKYKVRTLDTNILLDNFKLLVEFP